MKKQIIFFTMVALTLLACGGGAKQYSLKSGVTTPSDPATILRVTQNDWAKGNANAPAVLIEYSDFQCPACGSYFPLVENLMKDFPDTLRVVIRQFPLYTIHPNAISSALAAEAAGNQGKYWEMYSQLFNNQTEWSKLSDPRDMYMTYAKRIELDVEKFAKDMDSDAMLTKVSYDRITGDKLNINGTPSFFLNGVALKNPNTYEEFKAAVENAIKNK